MTLRLRKEFIKFPKLCPDASCHLVEEALDHWLVSFPFRSDLLTIHLVFRDYPFSPPQLWIDSPRLIRPHGSSLRETSEWTQFKGFTLFSGVPCWSLLGKDWAPSMTIDKVVIAFRALLEDSDALPDPRGGSYPASKIKEGEDAIRRHHKKWFEESKGSD